MDQAVEHLCGAGISNMLHKLLNQAGIARVPYLISCLGLRTLVLKSCTFTPIAGASSKSCLPCWGCRTFRRNETLPRLYHVSYIYHHPCQKQPKHGQSLSIRNCPKHAIASRHSGCAGPLYETDMSVLPSELCTKSLTAVTYHILSLSSGSQKPGKSNSFVFFVIL